MKYKSFETSAFLDIHGRSKRKARHAIRMVVFFCFFCLTSLVDAWAVDYWPPWVMDLSKHSATIAWKGDNPESAVVEYATESFYNEHKSFDKEVTVSPDGGYHKHKPLTDLEAGTSYVYRVKPANQPDVYNVRKFRTMPESGPFTFIVISDSHVQEGRFKYVANAIAQHESDILFILDGGDYASWDDKKYWKEYFDVANNVFAKFPIFHTIGNHEYHNKPHPSGPPTAAHQYHWSFDVPKNGPLNYSFDCSDVRFVVLNSPDPTTSHGDDPQTSLQLTESQVPWLEEQLNNNLKGTFTIHHHPIWKYGRSSSVPSLRPWRTVYEAYKISANFSGHVHDYQRFLINKIPYFISGNGGGVFNDIAPNQPYPKGYKYGKTRELGYLKVRVDPENNTATAEEIFVASVKTDTAVKAKIHNPPIVADRVTFPLSRER